MTFEDTRLPELSRPFIIVKSLDLILIMVGSVTGSAIVHRPAIGKFVAARMFFSHPVAVPSTSVGKKGLDVVCSLYRFLPMQRAHSAADLTCTHCSTFDTLRHDLLTL
jgi:hypothetical protein